MSFSRQKEGGKYELVSETCQVGLKKQYYELRRDVVMLHENEVENTYRKLLKTT